MSAVLELFSFVQTRKTPPSHPASLFFLYRPSAAGNLVDPDTFIGVLVVFLDKSAPLSAADVRRAASAVRHRRSADLGATMRALYLFSLLLPHLTGKPPPPIPPRGRNKNSNIPKRLSFITGRACRSRPIPRAVDRVGRGQRRLHQLQRRHRRRRQCHHRRRHSHQHRRFPHQSPR